MLSRNYPGRTEENSRPSRSAERCNYTGLLGEFVLRDFQLPPRSSWELRCSGLLGKQ